MQIASKTTARLTYKCKKNIYILIAALREQTVKTYKQDRLDML